MAWIADHDVRHRSCSSNWSSCPPTLVPRLVTLALSTRRRAPNGSASGYGSRPAHVRDSAIARHPRSGCAADDGEQNAGDEPRTFWRRDLSGEADGTEEQFEASPVDRARPEVVGFAPPTCTRHSVLHGHSASPGNRVDAPIRHTRRMRTLVTVVLGAVIAAGCGASNSTARSTSKVADAHSVAPAVTSTTETTTVSGITAEYVGPIAHNDFDATTGISLTVPPADAKPTLSWQQAVALCFTDTGICNRSAGMIRVSLAVGYNPQSGEALPDGAIEPTMNHNLVYVLAQPLGPCAPTGPSGANSRPSTYPSCTGLSFVDARTGEGATAVSGPSIRDPAAG